MSPTDPIRVRVLEGAKAVFLYFAPFYVFLLAIALIDILGVFKSSDLDANLLLLLLTYPGGAAAMGAVAGALVPVMRRLVGSILAGVVAVIPFVGGIAVPIENGFRNFSGEGAIVSAIMIVVFGPVVGLSVREGVYGDLLPSEDRRSKRRARRSRGLRQIIPAFLAGGLLLGLALGLWAYGVHWSVSLVATFIACV